MTAPDLGEPAHVSSLMRDKRGFRVPWFVDLKAPWRDGVPDFRIMDARHLKMAVRDRRCWICGRLLRGEPGTFVAGPMCGINRNSAEPPCHLECARWAVQICPFLAFPKRTRDESDIPTHASVAGIGITRNPGVTMLWTTTGYTVKPGPLFDIGEPAAVEWWATRRPATRDEVAHSIRTGLPKLEEQALNPADQAELMRRTVDFVKYLPPATLPAVVR